MSRTTTVNRGDRHFWTWDDSFGVWMAYLAEEIDGLDPPPADLAALAEDLHVVSAAIDLGANFSDVGEDSLPLLLQVAATARARAVDAGDISEEALRSWMAVDDLPVAGAFSRSRTGVVEIERILDVADTTIALLDGTLPADPPEGSWFVGHSGDGRVMHERYR